MSNTHISEIMPSDMPQWVWDAINEGLFARRAIEKVEKLEAQIETTMKLIHSCRDAWAPDHPPHDLNEFMLEVEAVMEHSNGD